MAHASVSTRNFRLMLVYHLSQHTPLFWPYMFYFVTAVRGLPASDFGLLKSIYYFTVMAVEVPFGVIADRLGRRWTLVFGALANSAGCMLYALGSSFATFALAELLFACTSALQSGADSALLYDAYAADGRTHEFARARGVLESAGLTGASLAFPVAGLLLTSDGDPSATYLVTAILSLAGLAAALAMREPPPAVESHVRAHVAAALRDLRHTPGLIATLLFGAFVYVGIRAANALVWNPVLADAGMPLASYGVLTSVVTLLGAFTAWRTDEWRRRVGTTPLVIASAGSIAAMYALLPFVHGAAATALLLSHGFAIGVVPVLLIDLLNQRITASERRATLLSFESLLNRGLYGVVVSIAAAGLSSASLDAVLFGFAAIAAVPLLLVPRLRARPAN